MLTESNLQNPNALDSKVLLDFDHVKKSLKVDDEGELGHSPFNFLFGFHHLTLVFYYLYLCSFFFAESKKMSSDNINVSGDIKQMLAELGTEKAKQTALLGGGGSKAQNERAAALTAILAARSRIKDSEKNGESNAAQAFSIVDAASASVHGRSAAAAKAASSDKTAARIAMHKAGERAPVNAKLVSLFLSLALLIQQNALREALFYSFLSEI